MSEKIITEATLKRIADKLKMSRILTKDLANGYKVYDWISVQDIVKNGLAPTKFRIGEQLIVNWTRNDVESNHAEKTYQVPLDIVHFGTIQDADGNAHHGMYLQWHYTTPFAIQFDAPENQPTTDETFQEGYYYYLKQENRTYVKQDIEYGQSIPKEGEYVRSIFDNAASIIVYGYASYSHSAYRQWLNSDADRGKWWEPQHEGDMPPINLNTYDGFLKGLDPDFLAVVKPIQVKTWQDAGIAKNEIGITIDRFFLPSVEELYGKSQDTVSGEGEPWEYWKNVTGLSEPNNNENEGRIKYGLIRTTTRSAYACRSLWYDYWRDWSWNCSSQIWYSLPQGRLSGLSDGNQPWNSWCCTPCCVIW